MTSWICQGIVGNWGIILGPPHCMVSSKVVPVHGAVCRKLATKPPALFIMIAFLLRPLKIDPAFFCDVVASLENRKADCQPI